MVVIAVVVAIPMPGVMVAVAAVPAMVPVRFTIAFPPSMTAFVLPRVGPCRRGAVAAQLKTMLTWRKARQTGCI